MGISINVAGVWKADPPPSMNVAGVWKTADQCSINVAGVWKDMLASGPTVDIKSNGRTNFRFGGTCYAGERFYTTGVEYEITNTNGSFSMGNWLTSGAASEVWVSYTRTGGTQTVFTGTTGGTRYQLSSNRSFYITASLSQYRTITATFHMYDAASGGNLLDTSASSTFIAEAEGGGCPLCCFTPDTLITMGSGLKMRIADVRRDDEILCYNPETQQDEVQLVREVIARTDVPMFRITFSDGRRIVASPDHPFHVVGHGPKSVGAFVAYKDMYDSDRLDVGDPVATEDDGYVTVTDIVRVNREPVVYTFSNSLFYANGLLVY